MSRRALMSSTTVAATTTVGDVRLQQQQAAGWHSPVPYLFGGLAAMLGLIAFALLILACSYWKLSSFPESSDENGADSKAGGKKQAEEGREMTPNVVVIMAGQLKPTFLATPSTSRTSSFGDSFNGDQLGRTTSASSRSDLSVSESVESVHDLHPSPAGDLAV